MPSPMASLRTPRAGLSLMPAAHLLRVLKVAGQQITASGRIRPLEVVVAGRVDDPPVGVGGRADGDRPAGAAEQVVDRHGCAEPGVLR